MKRQRSSKNYSGSHGKRSSYVNQKSMHKQLAEMRRIAKQTQKATADYVDVYTGEQTLDWNASPTPIKAVLPIKSLALNTYASGTDGKDHSVRFGDAITFNKLQVKCEVNWTLKQALAGSNVVNCLPDVEFVLFKIQDNDLIDWTAAQIADQLYDTSQVGATAWCRAFRNIPLTENIKVLKRWSVKAKDAFCAVDSNVLSYNYNVEPTIRFEKYIDIKPSDGYCKVIANGTNPAAMTDIPGQNIGLLAFYGEYSGNNVIVKIVTSYRAKYTI